MEANLSGIHIAAAKGDLDQVKYFLRLGVSIDLRCKDSWTPLHYAVKHKHFEVAKFLINNKCDLYAEMRTGNTLLEFAAKTKHTYLFDLLVNRGASSNEEKIKLLHEACQWGLLRAAQTVLHRASEKGWLDVVKAILERNELDIDLENSVGNTPLLLAAYNDKREVFDLLLNSGANLNCQDSWGRSVLHYAAIQGWPDVVERCTQVYADLSVVDNYSQTPLMIACCRKRTEVMKRLLMAGADCNTRNTLNKTALSYAIEHGISVVDVFKLLIENGAFLECTDRILIHRSRFFKEHILTDVGLCTQLIINKFNNKDLPALYQLPGCIEKLPSIQSLKIANNRRVPQQIKKAVEAEMEAKKCFDVMAVRPMVLQMLAVQTLINHHSTLKRSATQNFNNENVSVKKSRIV